MPEPGSNPFEFDAEYDASLDAPIEKELPQEGAAKKAGEVDPKPSATGKEARSAHHPISLRFAKDFGFTDDEINELSPEALDAAVRIEHRRMLKTSQEFRRNEERKPQEVAPPPKPEEKPAEPDEYAEFAEEVAPQVLAAIKKGREADKKVIESLRAKVDEFEGEKRQQAMTKFFDAVDAEFGKMPAAVKAVIGSEGRDKLNRVHHAVRKEILALADADATEGRSWQDKLKYAAREVVGAEAFAAKDEAEVSLADEYGTATPAKPVPAKGPDGRFATKPREEREAEWKTGGSAKPTQRESPLPKGERRAMETARKIMLSKGFLDEADMPADAFPG